MNYKLVSNSDNVLQLDNDGVILKYIPSDAANRDWMAYQAWLNDGNTPLAAD